MLNVDLYPVNKKCSLTLEVNTNSNQTKSNKGKISLPFWQVLELWITKQEMNQSELVEWKTPLASYGIVLLEALQENTSSPLK